MTQVSILMSVCGTSQWLGEALLSVVTSGADYELLIRANGEAEWPDVLRMAQHVPAERRLIFNTTEVMPLADSLNGMLDMAHGRYVMRLDPDDAIPPDALPELIIAAQRVASPPLVVYGDYLDFGESGNLIRANDATAQALAWRNVGPYNYLAPRWLFRKVGGWLEVGYEDWDLLVRLLAAGGQCVTVPRVTLYHRVRGNGRLASMLPQHAQHVRGILERNRAWFEAQGVAV